MNNASSRWHLAALCVLALCATTAAPAAAQGKGHGNGHKTNTGAGPSAAGAPELSPLSGTGIRNFGSWLDDASVVGEGQGSVSLAVGYWRTPAYREFDVPAVDAGLGVARRVQLGFSVPYYTAGEPAGPVARGLGDMYLTAKVQLRDPSSTKRHVGFSVTPIIEILSYAPRADAGRFSWALPGSVEVQRHGWRAFASAGYFSRGSLFASGAVEVTLTERASVMGSISRSHSIDRDDVSVALGLAQTRTDVGCGTTVALSPAMSLFGSVGRTISKADPNSSTVALTSGVAFSFAAGRRR